MGFVEPALSETYVGHTDLGLVDGHRYWRAALYLSSESRGTVGQDKGGEGGLVRWHPLLKGSWTHARALCDVPIGGMFLA